MSKPKTKHAIDRGEFIPATLSEKQVADYLGISTVTFHKWLRCGFALQTVKLDGYDTGRYITDDIIPALRQFENKVNRIYEENLINFKQKGGFG